MNRCAMCTHLILLKPIFFNEACPHFIHTYYEFYLSGTEKSIRMRYNFKILFLTCISVIRISFSCLILTILEFIIFINVMKQNEMKWIKFISLHLINGTQFWNCQDPCWRLFAPYNVKSRKEALLSCTNRTT